LAKVGLERESCWTESIAIGSKDFVEKIKTELGVRAAHKTIIDNRGNYELREPGCSYALSFIGKMSGLKVKIIRD
jgi:putative transposase